MPHKDALKRVTWRSHCSEHKTYTDSLQTSKTDIELPPTQNYNDLKKAINQMQINTKKNYETQSVNGNQVDPELSDEQKAVSKLILEERQNVFFTGAAGTGKSVLLRHIISQLRKNYPPSSYAITAMTGIAACNIGGQTLHSFAGIGLGQEDGEHLLDKVLLSRKAKMNWKQVEILLLDEVSMLQYDLFEKLDFIARSLRHSDKPFGGIQVVFCGDMFQLPPIQQSSVHPSRQFCFQSPIWNELITHCVDLTQVFRQQDERFANDLNNLRLGIVSNEMEQFFRSLDRPPKVPEGIIPTKLFPKKQEVIASNSDHLRKLPGTVYEYKCHDYRSTEAVRANVDLDRTTCEPILSFKVGAQVMLTKNLNLSLVNGSIGRIVAFVTQDLIVARDDKTSNDKDLDYQDSNPKKESDECSERFDKEGEFFDEEEFFANEEFFNDEEFFDDDTVNSDAPRADDRGENGSFCGESNDSRTDPLLDSDGTHAVVSRAKRTRESKLKRYVAEDLSDEDARKHAVLPLVEFYTPDRRLIHLLVKPETWSILSRDGTPIASRSQLPLNLAWSMSIHKSQGQTLPFVEANLEKVFAKGQVYVAISRATSIEGLRVVAFNKSKVRVDPAVVHFYKKIKALPSITEVVEMVRENKKQQEREEEEREVARELEEEREAEAKAAREEEAEAKTEAEADAKALAEAEANKKTPMMLLGEVAMDYGRLVSRISTELKDEQALNEFIKDTQELVEKHTQICDAKKPVTIAKGEVMNELPKTNVQTSSNYFQKNNTRAKSAESSFVSSGSMEASRTLKQASTVDLSKCGSNEEDIDSLLGHLAMKKSSKRKTQQPAPQPASRQSTIPQIAPQAITIPQPASQPVSQVAAPRGSTPLGSAPSPAHWSSTNLPSECIFSQFSDDSLYLTTSKRRLIEDDFGFTPITTSTQTYE